MGVKMCRINQGQIQGVSRGSAPPPPPPFFLRRFCFICNTNCSRVSGWTPPPPHPFFFEKILNTNCSRVSGWTPPPPPPPLFEENSATPALKIPGPAPGASGPLAQNGASLAPFVLTEHTLVVTRFVSPSGRGCL